MKEREDMTWRDLIEEAVSEKGDTDKQIICTLSAKELDTVPNCNDSDWTAYCGDWIYTPGWEFEIRPYVQCSRRNPQSDRGMTKWQIINTPEIYHDEITANSVKLIGSEIIGVQVPTSQGLFKMTLWGGTLEPLLKRESSTAPFLFFISGDESESPRQGNATFTSKSYVLSDIVGSMIIDCTDNRSFSDFECDAIKAAFFYMANTWVS